MGKLFSFFLFLFSVLVSAQDSINAEGITFLSDFEESHFTNFANGAEEDYIAALLGIDSTMTVSEAAKIKSNVDNFLEGLKKKSLSYNPKKKVKYIFNEVHDRFFRKYELDANFSDIFKSQTYNCVSGTALYTYAFDYLGVPYQIKETPTHVFLVAYPFQYDIYVETTLPGKAGSYVPSEFIIKKAIDNLVSMKILTSDYVNSVGYNKAYNDYYYGNENITKKDLVGIQYYNKGIFLLNGSKYQRAYWNMQKSSLVYENEKTKIFNEGILTLLMDELDFSNMENFKWFITFTKINQETDYLKYKLYSIISNDKLSEFNMVQVEEKLAEVENTDLRNALMETFYSFKAEKAYKFQNTSEALEYAQKIYELNPNNINAKNYIALIELDKLAQKNISDARLEDLTDLVERYPFLEEFGLYNRYRVYLYSFLVANSFNNNQKVAGDAYLNELEQLLKENKEGSLDFNQGAIGKAYGEIGAYFYRKGQKENAMRMLKRGLEFSPENEDIERKIRLINQSY